MKMRPGTPTGFLLCGKEWTEGESFEVRSPWDQGLVGRVTIATRADAASREPCRRQPAPHARLPRWKRREILEEVAATLTAQHDRLCSSLSRKLASQCASPGPKSIAPFSPSKPQPRNPPAWRREPPLDLTQATKAVGDFCSVSLSSCSRHHSFQFSAQSRRHKLARPLPRAVPSF